MACRRVSEHAAVVTLLDVSHDDERLLDLLDMLRPHTQSEVLRRVSIAACVAALSRRTESRQTIAGKAPEELTKEFLMRCMPPVPCGYLDDFGFEQRYHDYAMPLLARQCVEVVLASSTLDVKHSAHLAAELTKCAATVGPDFCAPDFQEVGFLEGDTVERFIDDWRDNFMANVSRLAARPCT